MGQGATVWGREPLYGAGSHCMALMSVDITYLSGVVKCFSLISFLFNF